MFNEKVMCLFKKDYEQLNKEGAKRGVSRFNGIESRSNNRMIAEIIYKDAYDAGRNDATLHCPLKEHPVSDYCLYEIDEDRKYHLELTEEQARVIQWLVENAFLPDVEFSEWIDTIEEVGRI